MSEKVPPTRMSVEAGEELRRRSALFLRVTQGKGKPMTYGSGKKDDKR